MNTKPERRKHYDCRFCRGKRGEFDSRICFWFSGEDQTVRFNCGIKDPETGLTVFDKGEERDVDSGSLMDLIGEVMDLDPKLSPLEALRIAFPTVCPKSLITPEIDELISMEWFCKEYHLPPLGTEVGYLDYPVVLREIISTISNARERVREEELAEMRNTK